MYHHTQVEDPDIRVEKLRESIRLTAFTWASRGLLENDKLVFLSLLLFKLMESKVVGCVCMCVVCFLAILIITLLPCLPPCHLATS